MEICAEKAEDEFLDDIRERVRSGKQATLSRWEALRLLLHIENQEELIEARAVERDEVRDELDQLRTMIAS